MKKLIALTFVGLLFIGCDSKDETFSGEGVPGLNGSWLLTEQGWSPGSGYNVDPVPPNPAQTISFTGHKTFASTMQGLKEFKFFVVVKDTSDITSLHLYVEDPDAEGGKPNSTKFYLELKDNVLKLMPIGCIEGCHFGFRRDALPRE